MASAADLDALRARIARAESERDTWRAAGDQEKYLAAYGMVEALQLQLDRQLRPPIGDHGRA